jgi:hypothetical protein
MAPRSLARLVRGAPGFRGIMNAYVPLHKLTIRDLPWSCILVPDPDAIDGDIKLDTPIVAVRFDKTEGAEFFSSLGLTAVQCDALWGTRIVRNLLEAEGGLWFDNLVNFDHMGVPDAVSTANFLHFGLPQSNPRAWDPIAKDGQTPAQRTRLLERQILNQNRQRV